jgi:hypothetical protein
MVIKMNNLKMDLCVIVLAHQGFIYPLASF